MKKLLAFCAKHIVVLMAASLTLGLAPFMPEPHIWGKLKWVAGGAVGMQAMDWFDLLLHGTPWLLLVLGVFGRLTTKKETLNEQS